MFRTPGYPLSTSHLVLFESSSRILLSNFYNCTTQQIRSHERVVTFGLRDLIYHFRGSTFTSHSRSMRG